MKALVLAGGSGTRLRPITHTSSKQLVPVANKPILFYALEHMAEAGITDVGMIVGDTAPEVMEAVGDGSRFGLSITYIAQIAPLGLAHTVLIARDFLGDDDFVMYLGDNLLRNGISDFVEAFEGHGVAAQILLAHVDDPSRFGVAELDSTGAVQRLVEKPTRPASDLALVGVYMFTSEIHDAVRAIEPSERGELEITDAIQWLIDREHRVESRIVDGYWKDLGELDALLDGNSLLLETLAHECLGTVDVDSSVDTRVRIEAGAVVKRSTIRGPVVIGRGCEIVDSYIGPFTAIGDRCRLVEAEIEHSMVLQDAEITGVARISDSLIGRDTKVARSDRRPKVSRLMIGDHSQIEIA